MKSCLTRFCPANHQMNCMVMVITEDSGFNYRYPVRGRKQKKLNPIKIGEGWGFNYRYPVRGRKLIIITVIPIPHVWI